MVAHMKGRVSKLTKGGKKPMGISMEFISLKKSGTYCEINYVFLNKTHTKGCHVKYKSNTLIFPSESTTTSYLLLDD